MNKPSYHRTFAFLLAEKIKKMTNCRNIDIIISIPLHKSKERTRGFNQAHLIARELSKEIKVLENSQLLTRIKNTKSQSKLDKNDRILNVKDAFQIKDEKKVEGKTLLLIDDIATTGATMGECSKSLLEAGAKEVICAVIASGRKH
jgi:competence protein ComFC